MTKPLTRGAGQARAGGLARIGHLVAMAGILVGALGQSKAPDPLVQARAFYNQQHYDEAIQAASTARAVPALANAAAVVFSRAHLERYRATSNPADLTEARTALATVDASKLSPQDSVELAIGLGESLYFDEADTFDDRYSAAAEEFEIALTRGGTLDAKNRDLLFDWWAQSLDRQAQQGPEADRKTLYARIVSRAADEVSRPDGSASASYWLAAASRGVDDLTRAVGAAVAGWVRAGSMGARGKLLRQDLDRLMQEVILPERARELALNADPRPELAELSAEWDALKAKWQPSALGQ